VKDTSAAVRRTASSFFFVISEEHTSVKSLKIRGRHWSCEPWGAACDLRPGRLF
jgi:hypothetical protein